MICINFADFCQKLSQFVISESQNILLYPYQLSLYTAMTHLRRKSQVRFYLGALPREWKSHILVSPPQN